MDPLQYLLSLEKFGIKFGLANIQTLAAALGHPHTQFKSILIAGTNGKGSVTAMTDMALRSAGLKVGRYTSPHLVRLEERFAIDGTPVDSGVLIGLIQEMQVLIDGLLANGALESPPTFFEVTTAIGFELFRRAHVDVAVLEVGLGGRLDATNIVQPIATAITSIDFDHEQYLGNTLAAIAAEKAGVLRRGIPVVVGPVPAEARDVLVSMSELSGATFIEADAGVRLESISSDGRTTIRLSDGTARLRPCAARPPRRPPGAECPGRRAPAGTARAARCRSLPRRLPRVFATCAGPAGCRCSSCQEDAACSSTPRTTPPAHGHWRAT